MSVLRMWVLGVVALAVVLTAAPDLSAADPAAKKAAPEVFQRMVSIGASVSAGLDPNRLKKDVTIAAAMDAFVKGSHEEATDASDFTFFMDAKGKAKTLLEKAKKKKPTLVVALDFLFWFAYGVKSNDQRHADLQEGLAMLAQFECPVLLGDLPDMRNAVGTGQTGLTRKQAPSVGQLNKLNAAIKAWAKKRENVIMVPLAGYVGDVNAGRKVKVGKMKWPAGAKSTLLHRDQLHATVDGTVSLAYLALYTLDSKRKDVKSKHYEQSVKKVIKGLREEKQ